MVRPSFRVFFNLRPALLLPPPNLVFVALQRSSRRTLATPPQLAQNPPRLHGMIFHPAFLLDQVGYAPRRPQTGFVAQRLRPTLQPLLDPVQVFGTQACPPPCMPCFLQRSHSAVLQLRRPTTDGLPMYAHLPCHLRLMNAFAQQLRGPQTPLF